MSGVEATTSPLVSVVIPVFNRAKVISRALDSVARQTFNDYEIIVVDDSSTDDTVDHVRNWGGDRLRLIRNARNSGAAAARNMGVSAASGRWIAFLDSDDCWEPDKLARQLAALDGAPAQFMACATGYYLWDGERRKTVQFRMPPDRFRVEIRFGCSISPGSTLLAARRAFNTGGGFDESLRRLEDWDWLLRFVDHGDIIIVPEPLVHVHRNRVEAACGDQDPVLLALQHMADRHLPRFEAIGGMARRQFQSSLLIEMAARMYHARRPLAAIRYVVASLAIYPFRNRSFFGMLWRSIGRAWTGA